MGHTRATRYVDLRFKIIIKKTPRNKTNKKMGKVGMGRWGLVLDVVHGSYGILGIILLCVAHEPKTTTATSVSVLDHHLCAKKLGIRKDSRHFQHDGG